MSNMVQTIKSLVRKNLFLYPNYLHHGLFNTFGNAQLIFILCLISSHKLFLGHSGIVLSNGNWAEKKNNC
jgi:hypothetical protein